MNRSIFDKVPEFEGRKEWIDEVMAENGRDIENAKQSINSELATAKTALQTAQSTIAELEKSKADVEEMQKALDAYKQKEAEAEAARQAEIVEAAIKARFKACVGEAEFVNEFTEAGAYARFKEAISDKANEGKADAGIYSAMMKDNESWLKNKQTLVNMTGVHDLDQRLLDKKAFDSMTLVQKMVFANQHPQEYAELSKR